MTTKEAQIALANLKLYISGGGAVDRSTNKAIDMAIKALEKPEPHWIPVTERLPEESGCYLVSVKNDHERRYSKTAWFGKDTWFARKDVVAWQPLPEPYKEATT